MRGFKIKAKLGSENSFEFFSPLNIVSFRLDDNGSYLKVFGYEWKFKRKEGEKAYHRDTIILILYSVRENPLYLRSLKVRMMGGFDNPFYSGIIFGICEAIAPFFSIENFISFERTPFLVEVEGALGIRVLKILKILYNFYKRR